MGLAAVVGALKQVLGFAEFMQRVDAEHLKRVIIGGGGGDGGFSGGGGGGGGGGAF
jgi:hypothetical protein